MEIKIYNLIAISLYLLWTIYSIIQIMKYKRNIFSTSPVKGKGGTETIGFDHPSTISWMVGTILGIIIFLLLYIPLSKTIKL